MITSPDNPRIKDAARLRKGRERRRQGLFIAEGPREVERALAAGLVVREIFLAPELMPELPAIAPSGAATRKGTAAIVATERTAPTERSVPTEEVSARVLSKLSYRAEPEGVIAIVEIPRHELPAHSTLLLVAVGIEKPGNLGAMARTADAAGADALLTADAQTDPWNPNAIRASTGAVFTLPIVEATPGEVESLRHQKVAAVLGARTPHTGHDYTSPTAFLIGAEDAGLSDEWRARADAQVEIPMHGTTADSLNASAAAAVLLFEAVRQRGAR